jgi:serine/threonine protein kinase
VGSAAATKQTIARYEILARIGAGGMAEVYRARAPGLGRARRLVAVKRMHPHLAESPEFIELFFREAQVASTLDHPNLVAVHESGEDAGQYYLVMEYVDGISLRQLIARVRKAGEAFDVAVAVSIAASICAGLHHAHERCDEDGRALQIVHRDVSPGNVFVSYDGAVKLGDFGVAKATAAWTAMQSTTGTIRGKVAYMAPEQARGDAVDRRADVFAVGNVLFELLTGRRLIPNGGEVEMLHALVFGAYAEPTIDRPDCPPALAKVIARALAREPEQRFATALEMQRALEAVAMEQGVFAPPSAVAAFVARHAVRPLEDGTDPNAVTRNVSPVLVTTPPPIETPTLTAEAIEDAPARRGWIAIPIVLAMIGAAAAWAFVGTTVTRIETASLHLEATRLLVAAPSLRRELSPPPAAPREAIHAATPSKPAKKTTKKKRRRNKASPSKSRKPPRGESLFPGHG